MGEVEILGIAIYLMFRGCPLFRGSSHCPTKLILAAIAMYIRNVCSMCEHFQWLTCSHDFLLSCAGIPYSEHSSYDELRRCVQALRPLKVIPTVNNSSAHKRTEMQRTFQQWLSRSAKDKAPVQTKLKNVKL